MTPGFGGESRCVAERVGEVGRIAEPEGIGNLRNGVFAKTEETFGLVETETRKQMGRRESQIRVERPVKRGPGDAESFGQQNGRWGMGEFIPIDFGGPANQFGIDGKSVRRCAFRDSGWRDQQRKRGESSWTARHELLQQLGTAVANLLEVVVDRGNGKELAFAERMVVACAENGDVVGDLQPRIDGGRLDPRGVHIVEAEDAKRFGGFCELLLQPA